MATEFSVDFQGCPALQPFPSHLLDSPAIQVNVVVNFPFDEIIVSAKGHFFKNQRESFPFSD